MSDTGGILGRLTASRRKATEDMKDEFLGNPKFANMIGSAVKSVRGLRRTFDNNLQFALNMLNLPTRVDYASLLLRIDAMNKSVSDLESRIDDLIAAAEKIASSGNPSSRKK